MTVASPPTPTRTRRTDWIGAVFVAVIWCQYTIVWLLDVESFAGFLSMIATDLAMTLAFIVWWLTRRSFTWGQRFLVIAVMLVTGLVVGRLSAGFFGPELVQFGIPIALTFWVTWVLATRGQTPRLRSAGLVACIVVIWSAFLLFRVDGLRGTCEPIFIGDGRRLRSSCTSRSTPPLLRRRGPAPGILSYGPATGRASAGPGATASFMA